MKKVQWADMTDDDPIPPYDPDPPEVSKHGIRVKKRPPSPHKDKTMPPDKSK